MHKRFDRVTVEGKMKLSIRLVLWVALNRVFCHEYKTLVLYPRKSVQCKMISD